MSTEEEKFKRSTRLHKDEAVIKRQVKIAQSHGIKVDVPHKFAKHHATNCGHPNCVMCGNPRRTFKEETIQEKRLKQEKLQLE